ncbi:MAG: hypothetical protein GY797_02160, partial [Deltaproteobacteria bacterium]|nr:hypothetical protein [Deltaproteobacteria bacterium]
MTDDTDLLEKREEVKRQLAASEYKILADILLDRIGHLIQKFSRSPKPRSFWYNALVMALITLLIGFLTSILLGEFYSLRREMILFEISMVGVAFTSVIISKVSI